MSIAQEPRVLVLSTDTKEQADITRSALARALTELDLAGEFGVYVAPVAGWFGVYLGRHDGGPVEPTPKVIEAARRFRQ